MATDRAAFPLKKILLAAALAPLTYARTILRQSLPAVGALAIGYAFLLGFIALTGEGDPNVVVFVITFLIGLLAIVYGYTLLAVTLHRLFLLGPAGVRHGGQRRWTQRETRFFGWGVALLLLTLPAAIVTGLVYSSGVTVLAMLIPFDPTTQADGWLAVLLAAWLCVSTLPFAYALGRLGFVLPATALGRQATLRWTLAFTRRYQWWTMAAVGAVPLGLDALIDFLAGLLPDWAGGVVTLVAGVYLGVLGLALLSFSYGFLRDAQPELLPPEAEDRDQDE